MDPQRASDERPFWRARAQTIATGSGRTSGPAVSVHMHAPPGLPHDPALPGLGAIRAGGLSAVIPALHLNGGAIELRLAGYEPGQRATLEVWTGTSHCAVTVYAGDVAPLVRLYETLAAAGLAATEPGPGSDLRVPPLLAWDLELRLLVVGWLDGPTAHDLIRQGDGPRAGTLAARWLQRAVSVSESLGPSRSAASVLRRVGHWIDELSGDDPELGEAGTAVLGRLAQSWPLDAAPRVVHGAFHARNVIDLGEHVGVIDWRHHGQGPAELDAAVFLATTRRTGLLNPGLAVETAQAEDMFLAAVANLVDERALAWYRAAMLLHLAAKQARRRRDGWRGHAHALLLAAARLSRTAG